MRLWWPRLRPRVRGFPTSANAASSFHLHWQPGEVELVSASAVLEVVVPPVVPHLYFWALQVSFAGPSGITGGAHLGLQWISLHPGRTAANFGGYDSTGRELEGSTSSLPSAPGNPNTRDYPWAPGRPYRLSVARGPHPGTWSGEVTDLQSGLAVVVRTLYGGGDRLLRPMLWSEVFARCDDPSVEVRWSRPAGATTTGAPHRPAGYRVTYQAVEAGGCANSDCRVDPDGVRQVTSVGRSTPDQALISAGQDPSPIVR
jgi:hypothetical protein